MPLLGNIHIHFHDWWLISDARSLVLFLRLSHVRWPILSTWICYSRWGPGTRITKKSNHRSPFFVAFCQWKKHVKCVTTLLKGQWKWIRCKWGQFVLFISAIFFIFEVVSSFYGIKRPRCEVDHSAPSCAEVKNEWSYTSIPQYVFMEWCLI
jgi:hypothetical protein